MRPQVRYLMICFVSTCYTSMVCGQSKSISVRDLPQKAKHFLQVYYSRTGVASISSDVESWFRSDAYHVLLQDGKRIEFDEQGNWREVDGHRKPLPIALVPEQVLTYLARSFPKTDVVRMRRKAEKYLVAISNGLELEFNKKGEFIKINQQ
ncbi:PepSY-like domain-containing protein [Sphingobacterium sp. lm-10]|uniref:PepSY-like domain-containing protein n=1 Tax=Sphingobacterium sp. lm-10 TaxID=2944904 RepID=UPI0020227761|nr:PepSY-like domain-containing protein [Sphingobacterium sp. lm-10]MCL7987851.1 PepSY-like domain-containing protein [Sphingobacterium sp. lm-10]